MSSNDLAVKSPGAALVWTFDFSADVPSGVTVSAITTTVPTGLARDAESPDLTNKKTLVRISSGTHGQTYRVKSVATLSNGETVEGFLTLRVIEGAA